MNRHATKGPAAQTRFAFHDGWIPLAGRLLDPARPLGAFAGRAGGGADLCGLRVVNDPESNETFHRHQAEPGHQRGGPREIARGDHAEAGCTRRFAKLGEIRGSQFGGANDDAATCRQTGEGVF